MNMAFDALLDGAEWKALDLKGARFTDEPDALYATHEATLEIGDSTLRCYQLNDGSEYEAAPWEEMDDDEKEPWRRDARSILAAAFRSAAFLQEEEG